MRGLVQRVREASVSVDGRVVGAIGAGICLLVGITHDDDVDAARRLASKVWSLRIMADEEGTTGRGGAGGAPVAPLIGPLRCW